ncbi:hypothetical protein R3P38DRAFT_1785564 [Favolaschia claudopus]|uniref:3-beta hydroxysteroid dehydrogenase/isomerase domain-containing protein n=1 Tax=Favolaschia claudopus TaxID=2862362 RepID=A0AAW0A751_9AGAR
MFCPFLLAWIPSMLTGAGGQQSAGVQLGNNNILADWTYVANVAHAAILAADRQVLPSFSPAARGHASLLHHRRRTHVRSRMDIFRALWMATGQAEPEPKKQLNIHPMFVCVRGGWRDGFSILAKVII